MLTFLTFSAILFYQNTAAQDLSGLSIAIDPGHGKGNAIQGPTGLREADINLGVALFLKDFLKSANIDTVLLTRVDDSTNPTLSQRETFANSFGVDWFHSVHHNAFNGTARFTLLLYEELATNHPQWPGKADVMSNIMAERIWQALRTSDFKVFGDFSFFGSPSYLGVLRDLLMPGELSEATFHDNRIEENKLRNNDFLKLEARAIFMAILDFYEAGTLPTGALSGIIKDAETNEPLNGINVTLNPGGMHYTTDDNNNGLYIFQDLEPGTYQITVSANDYITTQKSVTVTAHAFKSADFSLLLDLPPIVKQTLPPTQSENVNVYNEIGMLFNRPMDRQSVEAAFVITPETAGHFLWSAKGDVVLFEPDTRFAFATLYDVTLNATAADTNGNSLDGNGDGIGGDSFTYNFTTQALDNSKPVVLDFYPTQRDTGVFLKDVLTATFNRELDPQSINQNTVLLNSDGGLTPAIKTVYLTDGSKKLNIIPIEPLKADKRYFVTLTQGINSVEDTQLASNFVWQFNTQTNDEIITVFDRFETSLDWNSPQASPISTGFSAPETDFTLSSQYAISGIQSGQLNYKFLMSDGLLQIDRKNPQEIDLQKCRRTGCYVFGDSSNNELRLLFADSDGTEASTWFTIDWRGWRFLSVDLTNPQLATDGTGNGAFDADLITFSGFQFKFAGNSQGAIFVDDFIETESDVTVSVRSSATGTNFDNNFILAQNYPNPFNPQTVINYRVPDFSRVDLAVFNLQGQKVRTLVNSSQSPGDYRVIWNGKDDHNRLVSNGVYVYRIKLNNRSESRKMIFLK